MSTAGCALRKGRRCFGEIGRSCRSAVCSWRSEERLGSGFGPQSWSSTTNQWDGSQRPRHSINAPRSSATSTGLFIYSVTAAAVAQAARAEPRPPPGTQNRASLDLSQPNMSSTTCRHPNYFRAFSFSYIRDLSPGNLLSHRKDACNLQIQTAVPRPLLFPKHHHPRPRQSNGPPLIHSATSRRRCCSDLVSIESHKSRRKRSTNISNTSLRSASRSKTHHRSLDPPTNNKGAG